MIGRIFPASISLANSISCSRLVSTMKKASLIAGFSLPSAFGRDRHDAAAFFDGLERTHERFAADQIQDHIGIIDHLLELRFTIIDDFMGAQTSDEFSVWLGNRCDDQSALPGGKLNGETANTARPAMDKNLLACLYFSVIEQCLAKP